MTITNAHVIGDSMSDQGYRLTTIETTYPRFVHSEMMTHRTFSRNAASSRAIPLRRMLDRVKNDPALPVSFPAEQRGMQGGEELSDDVRSEALATWLDARDHAVDHAARLAELGVHKSVVNRILEPWAWMTVIITATDWTGFWHQRCSPLAQPEIRVAAEAMRAAYDASTPTEVGPDHWHTPYVRDDELDLDVATRTRISAARCARVSYLTHDGRRDLAADEQLYERLVTADPPHWSPLEHVARPLGDGEAPMGNLRGWRQLRHEVEMSGSEVSGGA